MILWCSLWAIKHNLSHTKTMVLSRSRTVAPWISVLRLNDVLLVEYLQVGFIGLTFDARLTYESYLRTVAGLPSQRISVMRRA